MKTQMFVSGFTAGNSGIGVIVRDRKSPHPLIRTNCTKAGTLWLLKGITMEEAKAAFPFGTDLGNLGYTWGENVPASKDGIVLQNVYKIEEPKVVAESGE